MLLKNITSLLRGTSISNMPGSPKQVCVIGAGAAGLCAAKHLLHNTHFTPVVFEQTEFVGGTWVYNEAVGKDKHGNPVHSSMYKRMRTNLPKEAMAFPDYPFPESEGSSFLPHQEVLQYLESYCDHFQLRPQLRMEHCVADVQPEEGQWRVTVKDLRTKQTSNQLFAAVIVCNGHYSVPHIAHIKGIELFEGKTMHSHDYRVAEQFTGETVAVLGGAASGIDISLEIAKEAEKVYLSHNNPPLKSALPENLDQVSGIVECIGPDRFLLGDGTEIYANYLLFCTGYQFTFPFLSKNCSPQIENRVLDPLYKHLLHVDYPTLGFIGIPFQVLPFPFFNTQVQWFCKTLCGEVQIPSREEMLKDIEAEKKLRLEMGIPEKNFHKFGAYQWGYMDMLADMAGVSKLNPSVKALYEHVNDTRVKTLLTYKNNAFFWKEDRFQMKK